MDCAVQPPITFANPMIERRVTSTLQNPFFGSSDVHRLLLAETLM
jgi:hypothetical protein